MTFLLTITSTMFRMILHSASYQIKSDIEKMIYRVIFFPKEKSTKKISDSMPKKVD